VNDLEQRLSESLVRRAQTVLEPVFTADDVVHAGRSAVVRRRVLAASGALAAVVAAVLLATNVLGGDERALPPVGPTSPPSSVAPTPPSAAGLTVVGFNNGKTVTIQPNGTRSTLDLPPDLTVLDVIGVSGGWLVHARAAGDQSHGLWIVPEGADTVHVVDLEGNYEVSADGRTLAAVVVGGEVVAYELPSLQERRRIRRFNGQPFVVGIADDLVLLREPSSDGAPTKAAVWNLANNLMGPPTENNVNVWSLGSGGQAPVAIVTDPATGGQMRGCLSVATLRPDALPENAPGFCATDESGILTVLRVRRAAISPGGDQLAVESYDERRERSAVQMVTVADLNAGRWQPRPTNAPPDNRVLFWDSRDTFVTASRGPDDFGAPYYRCGTNGACTPLTLPTDLTEARVVPVYGGG